MGATYNRKGQPSVCTHLHKRGNVYYFRRVLPRDMAEFFGKREFIESLGTKDRREAEIACRRRDVVTDQLFAKARGMLLEEQVTPGPKPQARPMTPEQAQQQERAQADWEEWNTEQGLLESVFEDEIREEKAQMRAGYRSLMAFAQQAGIGLNGAQHEALQAIFAKGHAAGDAKPPEAKDKKALSLWDVADKWARERKPQIRTIKKMDLVIRRFEELVGKRTVRKVERAHIVTFKDKLLESGQTPVNTDKTLTMLHTLLNYAADNGIIDSPPAKVNAGGKRAPGKVRYPFDLTALQAIFGSPVYAEHYRPVEGRGEAAYWLPLLGLFSGARVTELAQLRPDDVYEELYRTAGGHEARAWVIRVTNEGEGQAVKTQSSLRRFPVHPALIELGFIEYAKAQKEKGAARLFDEIKPDSYGSAGGLWSKWFGEYLRRQCGVMNPKMVFHSFRHSFKDYARAAGMPEDVADAITGHRTGSVARGYGGLDYPLAPLVEAMQRYSVPGLVLPAKPNF